MQLVLWWLHDRAGAALGLLSVDLFTNFAVPSSISALVLSSLACLGSVRRWRVHGGDGIYIQPVYSPAYGRFPHTPHFTFNRFAAPLTASWDG